MTFSPIFTIYTVCCQKTKDFSKMHHIAEGVVVICAKTLGQKDVSCNFQDILNSDTKSIIYITISSFWSVCPSSVHFFEVCSSHILTNTLFAPEAPFYDSAAGLSLQSGSF